VRRREVIAALAGCMSAASTSVHAQRPARVGVLALGFHLQSANFQALRLGFRDLGYIEGRNLDLTFRFAEGRSERLIGLAADLVRGDPEVLVADGGAATRALMATTSVLPIVAAATGAPVEAGFAASLARPGGKVTGFSNFGPDLAGKRIELMQRLVPELSRILIIHHGETSLTLPALTERAGSVGLTVHAARVQDPARVGEALAPVLSDRVGWAIVVLAEPAFFGAIETFVAGVESARVPAIYPEREYAEAGGLVGFGPNIPELFRKTAGVVDRILKGADPAEIPFEQPSRLDLVINQRRARMLGLTIPPDILVSADEVIE
jgi:putative ABC transport system substrate-binding protein